MTPGVRAAQIWRRVRPWRSLAAGLALYAIVRAVFVHAVGSQGLLTPGRPADRWLAGLALAALVLRAVVLIAVPAVVTYRIVEPLLRRPLDRWLRRRPGPPP